MNHTQSANSQPKLIIQIPCFNEEATLPITLSFLPRKIPGIDKVEWMIIDDGSTDKTIQVAKAHDVDHIVSHSKNLGLAKAFMTGIRSCLERGADIIVNTDADNQYSADCIPSLIQPILEGKAELVVGARSVDEIESFSHVKKLFHKIGSWIVRIASNTNIPDAPSGFRAISRKAARDLNVFNNYTYTLETIIQAGQKNIPITWVPIHTNKDIRPSRLIKNMPTYIFKSIITIIRIFVVYRPFRFFMIIGAILFSFGILIGLRYMWYYFTGDAVGHVQSLILSSILIGMGFQTILIAFVVDLQSVNRRLLEELLYKSRDNKGRNE
jgi:glycosyltransferase involved in cell wall biosynthesis